MNDSVNAKNKKRRLPAIIAVIVVISIFVSTFAIGALTSKNALYPENDFKIAENAQALTVTLANGDSYYTPESEHSVIDDDRTIYYYDNLLVVFTDYDLTDPEIKVIEKLINGKTVGKVSGAIHALQLQVEKSTLAELESYAEKLMQEKNVMYACSDYPVQIMGNQPDNNPWSFSPDEKEIDLGNENSPDGFDWWAEAIGAYTAWEYTDLCQEINVGIVDDGFETEHEDLKGQITLVSDSSTNTSSLHGTHVAGIIGALNNDVGLRGIADTANLYCADVWKTNSSVSYHTLTEYLAVVNYMIELDVKVINNSWGCYIPNKTTYLKEKYGAFYPFCMLFAGKEYKQWCNQRVDNDLITTAEATLVMISQIIASGNDDIIFVVSAGNGYSGPDKPADVRTNGFFCAITESVFNELDSSLAKKLSSVNIDYKTIDEHILIVGAAEKTRDENGNYAMSTFSNYGETVDICAPGTSIFSTVTENYGLYEVFDGTSMAAPMVTASVAFIWSLNPELTAAEVREILIDSAQVTAVATIDDIQYSYPMLNIGNAAKNVAENK